MKARVCWLLMLCVILLSNTAFAANWVYIDRGNSLAVGNYDAYVDKDSAIRNGNNVVYWEMQVLDVVDENTGSVRDLFKVEASTSNPRQYRILEYYAYDAKDRVIGRSLTPTEFTPVGSSQLMNKEIDFALQYAK